MFRPYIEYFENLIRVLRNHYQVFTRPNVRLKANFKSSMSFQIGCGQSVDDTEQVCLTQGIYWVLEGDNHGAKGD
jgi:hypothetical protein